MAESNRYWLAGGDKRHESMTQPARRFASEQSRLLDLIVFFSESSMDRLQRAVTEKSPEARQYLAEYESNRALVHELTLTRVVDSFLCYVSELLALLYKSRPEMLRSSETERIDFILQHESMDDLRIAIAERKVERLSFLSLRDLAENLNNQMGFGLFQVSAELNRAAYLVELRNIFVHSRGVVGPVSARRFPDLQNKIGTRISLEHESLREDRRFLENAVFDIDARAIEKFSIASSPVPPQPSD